MDPHPSLGKPVRWLLVRKRPDEVWPTFDVEVEPVDTTDEADVLVIDLMTATYIAPGAKPRTHAVILTPREPRGRYPGLLVVFPTFPADRPLAPELVDEAGRLVGDAIAVGRCAGHKMDVIAVAAHIFENIAKSVGGDKESAARRFFNVAHEALKATTRPRTK